MTTNWINDEMNDSEKEYYRSIDACAENKSNKFIENSMAAHATYLMVKMFANATTKIRLFSGSLCLSRPKDHSIEKVYASEFLIKEAIKFLRDRNGTLEIVIEQDIEGGLEQHPLVKAFDELKSNGKNVNVTIRKVDDKSSLPDVKHFMLMDNQAYRVEYDHNNTKALANFGDTELATSWSAYFDKILVKSSSVIYQNHLATS